MSSAILSILTAAAVVFYLVAGVQAKRTTAPLWILAAPLAIALHLLVLGNQIFHEQAISLGIREALSLFAWQSALFLWLLSSRQPLRILGVAIYPLAALAAAIASALPDPINLIPIADWKIQLHIMLSLFAAGFLTLASVQAITLAAQDRLLHQRAGMALVQALPPLQTMERLLFQLIGLGFFLLSLSLISGLLFVKDLLGQHLAHKTVLSAIAWLLFGLLLWGRWRHGWRGRAAIRWTLTGYLVLIVAYFGSKWVLEQVLHKHWT
jgi:ABC-type uncharacterized transport system permease subunit